MLLCGSEGRLVGYWRCSFVAVRVGSRDTGGAALWQ